MEKNVDEDEIVARGDVTTAGDTRCSPKCLDRKHSAERKVITSEKRTSKMHRSFIRLLFLFLIALLAESKHPNLFIAGDFSISRRPEARALPARLFPI